MPSSSNHKLPTYNPAHSFDTSWIPRFPIVARGKDVQVLHREKLLSYLSVAVPDSMPSPPHSTLAQELTIVQSPTTLPYADLTDRSATAPTSP